MRKYMSNTRIVGCIASFTFMSNDINKIKDEVKRDCKMIKETGKTGLNIYTAGSIINGSTLTNMKAVIETILEFGRN